MEYNDPIIPDKCIQKTKKNWKYKKISDVASFVRGFSYKGSEKNIESGKYLFVTLNSIKEGGSFKREFCYIISDRLKEKNFVKQGEIVIANTEQSKDGSLLGSPAIVEFPNSYNVDRAVFSHHITKIKIEDDTNKDFLYYFLIFNQKKAVLYSTGSVVWALDIESWSKNELIPVPPLNEQKAIAKILSDLDSKIELNQKMNKTLEAIAQAIFRNWFIDFEFPNEEGKPYKSSGGEMVDSELGEIPMSWEVKRIKDLCISIENGGTPKRMEKKYWNGEINWFKTGELNDRPLTDSAEKITREGLMNSSCKLWKINTILIALYASPTVGRLGLLKVDGASNQACSGLVAKDEIGYPYLFYTLFFKRDELNNIATGAAQQNISQEIIKESVCIQPPLKLLDNFNWMVSRLIDRQTLLAKEQATLSNIRDSILPKLLTGKIRAPLEG